MAGERPQPQLSFMDLPGSERAWRLMGVAQPWALDAERPDLDWSDRWEHHYQLGNAAFNLAQQIEALDGLTPAAIAAYQEASSNLIMVMATVPPRFEGEDIVFPIPDDATRLFKIATSYERQAQAEKVEPYSSAESRHIDRRLYMRSVAKATFRKAGEIIMGKGHPALEMAGEITAVNPAEVLGSAIKQAVLEVKGPKAIDEETAERLGLGDEEAVSHFMEAQVPVTVPDTEELDSDPEGAEIASRTGEIVLEKITELHRLPVAAGISE